MTGIGKHKALKVNLNNIHNKLTVSLKWFLWVRCTASVKCSAEPLGNLHSSSSKSIIPVVFTSMRPIMQCIHTYA